MIQGISDLHLQMRKFIAEYNWSHSLIYFGQPKTQGFQSLKLTKKTDHVHHLTSLNIVFRTDYIFKKWHTDGIFFTDTENVVHKHEANCQRSQSRAENQTEMFECEAQNVIASTDTEKKKPREYGVFPRTDDQSLT